MHYNYNWSFLIRISLATALGGYLFGFDFAVITGGLPFLRDQFDLNPYQEGLTTGSLALGCIIGCIIAGGIADKFGRKPGLITAALIFFVSSFAMAVSPGLTFFIASRFIAGIGVGMASMLSPMYIAEISPPEVRGRMVALNQLTIVLGQVITHFENFALKDIEHEAWRWMFGMGMIPSFLFFIGVLFIPESPRWMLGKGREQEAAGVLARLGNNLYASSSLKAIKAGIQNEVKASLRNVFARSVWPIVSLGIGLAVFQQFCGINVVFNYTTNIFESIGASSAEQLLQAVYISLANLFFTIIAMLLVDKWGRRPLMLIGSAGLAVLYVIIGNLLNSGNGEGLSLFILMAIGTYAVSLAPLTWVLISEIFPNKIRGKAMSVAIVSLWMAYFILVTSFPVIERRFGDAAAFFGYAVICAAGFIFIYKRLPETKGKSLETIEKDLVKNL
jgi:SP family xylose:H+ symportor-like MFS transporter